jgi:hypothetical protein
VTDSTVIPIDQRFHKRAPWGPVHIDANAERVRTSTPDSGLLEIEIPSAHSHANDDTVAALREGVPVLVDGTSTFTLTQPQRSLRRRADRVIEVAGDPALVPPGLVLRARWLHGVALEVPDGPKMIRPRCDIIETPYFGFSVRPAVAPDVAPELIALWGAAWWHLICVLHV